MFGDLISTRNERFHKEQAKVNDERTAAERDYDRILYSSAFLRLAGVAQVAHAEDHCIVHNRLIHSLKVARIGRGLAVRMCRDASSEMLTAVGGVDPAVVEAAALAHDLGDPPFGHIAEEELNKLVHEHLGEFDGFEGNAQSFRVVTKLSSRDVDYPGLNLIHVFYREQHHAPFIYQGKAVVKHFELFADKPSKFEFELESLSP